MWVGATWLQCNPCSSCKTSLSMDVSGVGWVTIVGPAALIGRTSIWDVVLAVYCDSSVIGREWSGETISS